jgi:processive 1,2-diacylglycerol beta-glucosyltransferase
MIATRRIHEQARMLEMHAVNGRDAQFSPAGKKILVLSVPAGAGHTRVAQAIHACAVQGAVSVTHLDAMAFAAPGLRRIYTDLYILLVRRAPGMWGHVYRMTNAAPRDGWMNRLRRWVERRACAPLLKRIAELDPDAVVCTHFQPAELLSRQTAAGAFDRPVWVQVTDFDLHRMWVHPHIAGYLAPNDEVAFHLRRHGIPAANIHVTGIPIMPAFAGWPDRAECALALGLDPALTTLLLMGGGAGLGRLSELAGGLLALPGQFQLIVVAGRNVAELAALRSLAALHPGRLAPLGYTDQVERLMACADLAITKPGGSTTAECMAMGLPMIVNAPIPGQEERNANYLLEHGAAFNAFDLPSLEYRIRHLLADPARLDAMRVCARRIGRPHAARQAFDTILKQLDRDHEIADESHDVHC